mgnify:CR=1 FL=1
MQSPRMRVLVTGGSGGLGRYVVPALLARGFEVKAPSHAELDITCEESVRTSLATLSPQVIVHLAALSNVDRCFYEPEEASRLNVLGTEHLVRWARRGPLASFVYMSTNDVFSECREGGPFDESRTPAPGMPYSWSKWAGEQAVLAIGGLVIRANFFTRHCNAKQSFAAYVIENAREGRKFACYTNVLATPIFAGTLAERIGDAVQAGAAGILHIATRDAVSRVTQAEEICKAYGLPTNKIQSAPLLDRRGRPLDARLTSLREGLVGDVAEEIGKMVREEPL